MKKVFFVIAFILLSISSVAQFNTIEYIDWQLHGEGVNQGVYDKPSFYWKVIRDLDPVDGYYTFYLYLVSNSGLTSYTQQNSIPQYTKRSTELYELQLSVCLEEEQINCVDLGKPFWQLAYWEITEPIEFTVDYPNPIVMLNWKSLRIY